MQQTINLGESALTVNCKVRQSTTALPLYRNVTNPAHYILQNERINVQAKLVDTEPQSITSIRDTHTVPYFPTNRGCRTLYAASVGAAIISDRDSRWEEPPTIMFTNIIRLVAGNHVPCSVIRSKFRHQKDLELLWPYPTDYYSPTFIGTGQLLVCNTINHVKAQ